MATFRSAWRRPSIAFPPTRTRAVRRPGTRCRCAKCACQAGAGFVVVVCGEIMTMPGLPRVPSAEAIRINDEGQIDGLF